MNFLFRWTMDWKDKKVFFQIHDMYLIRLLILKGIQIVHSFASADVVIVYYRQSCFSLKEIALSDLYFLLTEQDQDLYYSWRIKHQYQPTMQEHCWYLFSYMVILNPSEKTIRIYADEKVPFLKKKLFTKQIIACRSFLSANKDGNWITVRLTNRKQLVIHKHIYVERNIQYSGIPFLFQSHYNWLLEKIY